VLDRNGNVTRILKFATDITARKQQEAELVRMDQLEDALEEVRAREAEIQRLLKVTQYNEQQLQDVEQSYRSTIAQLSLRVKQLEGEMASSQAVAS
jgi:DNA repair exonuclease SbcCD ATPase subunit